MNCDMSVSHQPPPCPTATIPSAGLWMLRKQGKTGLFFHLNNLGQTKHQRKKNAICLRNIFAMMEWPVWRHSWGAITIRFEIRRNFLPVPYFSDGRLLQDTRDYCTMLRRRNSCSFCFVGCNFCCLSVQEIVFWLLSEKTNEWREVCASDCQRSR